ncbi:MAG: oxidoreductase [Pseudomonadota bacterium]
MSETSTAPKKIASWTPARLTDLSGKTYLITGGNSGIGLGAANLLARKGAQIIIAARDPEKGESARAALPPPKDGTHKGLTLDLADLSSVRRAADETRQSFGPLDGLINNAGIMQTPPLKTADGFEMQLGTNHIGHFLFAALLYDRVKAASGRIVTVSSLAHRFGRINFEDLMLAKAYSATAAYTQSKLANLMFALALHRRLKAAGSPVASIACHPGYTNTRLQSTGPRGLFKRIYAVSNPMIAQSPEKGAYPTVLAAAAPEAAPGGYYGPQGMGEMRGLAADAKIMAHAKDEAAQDRLWSETETLLDFTWPPL